MEEKKYISIDGKNIPLSAFTDNKDVIEFADKYSYKIWLELMDNFKTIKDYKIGANDVSDIVLNAIISTYNFFNKNNL